MKIIGKIITTNSDNDEQPIVLIDLAHLSLDLEKRVKEALVRKEEYFDLKLINNQLPDYDELKKHNQFNKNDFPLMIGQIDGYIDFWL